MDEQPRPVANADEQAYTLTVEEAASLYEAAGHARTMRAIQKYCARSDLDSIREQTTYSERFRITPASVARHIEQIAQLSQAHRRGRTRTFAQPKLLAKVTTSRPFANSRGRTRLTILRYPESENAFLRAQNDKKDQQLERRDHQIETMIQRDQETNFLIKRLSDGIPMLAQPDRQGEQAHRMQYTDMPDETAAEGRG